MLLNGREHQLTQGPCTWVINFYALVLCCTVAYAEFQQCTVSTIKIPFIGSLTFTHNCYNNLLLSVIITIISATMYHVVNYRYLNFLLATCSIISIIATNI